MCSTKKKRTTECQEPPDLDKDQAGLQHTRDAAHLRERSRCSVSRDTGNCKCKQQSVCLPMIDAYGIQHGSPLMLRLRLHSWAVVPGYGCGCHIPSTGADPKADWAVSPGLCM